MVCKSCKYENPDGVAYCGHCGARMKNSIPRPLLIALVALAAVAVLVLMAVPFGKNDDPVRIPTESTEGYSQTEATEAPTEEATETPTEEPTEAPTEEPTDAPTEAPTEAPTAPPLTTEERLPNIPEQWYEHVLLGYRAAGSCEIMRDQVVVTVFFVEDPESHWTEDLLAGKKAQMEEMALRMEQDAAGYGVALDVLLVYQPLTSDTAQVDGEDAWLGAMLTNAGLPGVREINQHLEKTYDVEAAPVVLVLNRPGRAHASWNNAPNGQEYLVLYEDVSGLRHELCHLFGAVDYYYPDLVVEQAKLLFPNSLMAANDVSEVDALTAYLIGWTDELSADAWTFLEATANLTSDEYWSSMGDQTYTGYIEKEMSYGFYAGEMLEGLLHGQGKLTWSSGATYEGQWYMGAQHGQGTYTSADGSTYIGAWENGSMHGYGVYTWASGTIYDGWWADGTQNGEGTMRWEGGTTYTGQWVNGTQHGQGTMTYSNGYVESGTWENGKFVG